MIVLVCGGRKFSDYLFLSKTLAKFHDETPFTKLIHGEAPGADTLAGTWAATQSIPVRGFPAFWRTHGRAAGPIRNKQMLDEGEPDLVIAFPGGVGTNNMITQALKRNITVVQIGNL